MLWKPRELLTKLVEGRIIVALKMGQGFRNDVSCRSFRTADVRECLVAEILAEYLLRAPGLSGSIACKRSSNTCNLADSQIRYTEVISVATSEIICAQPFTSTAAVTRTASAKQQLPASGTCSLGQCFPDLDEQDSRRCVTACVQ